MKRRQFVKVGMTGAVLMFLEKIAQAGHYKMGAGNAKINTLVNKKSPSNLEKKHVPLVEAPKTVKKGRWFDVNVKVGFMLEHPSIPEHWIDRIELHVGGKKVSEVVNLAGGITSSNACFEIRLNKPGDTKLEAVADCNLHGTWLSEPVHIKVT